MARDRSLRGFVLLAAGLLLAAAAPDAGGREDLAWLFPRPSAPAPPLADPEALVTLPGSAVTLRARQFRVSTAAVDWYPGRHGMPPAIVLKASAPEGYACGFCHLVGGEGRPENASLAGLSEAYIIAQTRAFRAGERQPVRPGWLPIKAMATAVAHASDAEIAAAAKWFSGQTFVSRVTVIETDTVPATAPLGYILAPVPGPREPIAGRVIEVPDDLHRFELRDPDSRFTAWVPPGSIARGVAVAERLGCIECHSGMLGGWGPGRSPSYIVRQLLAFKTGVRSDAAAQPMREVTAEMSEAGMIDVAAWFASLPASP